MHHKHHEPRWILNNIRSRSLQELAAAFESIANSLRTHHSITVNDTTIIPTDPCEFTLRYERTPKGDLKFKLELTWPEDGQEISAPDGGDLVFGSASQ